MATPDISPSKLAAKLQKKTSAARVDDLADAIMQKFGGLGKFAEKYVDEFDRANKGSVARSRLLAGVVRLVEVSSKKEQGSAVDEMSDSDLESIVGEMLQKVLKATPIVDMQVEGAKNGAPPNATNPEPGG